MNFKLFEGISLLVFITVTENVAGEYTEPKFYPCSWVKKVFKVSIGNTTVGSWDFDFTGKGSILEILNQVLQLERVDYHGQFLILRKIDTDMMTCMSIHNITANAFKFYFSEEFVYKPQSICEICKEFKPFIARVDGKSDSQISSSIPKCIYPEECAKFNTNSLTDVCNKNTQQKIDEGTCDRTPPKMPKMKNMKM